MYTLLTGATGLVGRYLVRDLLLNGHDLAVVVRPSKRQTPRERMESILQHWEDELGRPLPRPIVLAGDIKQPGFGLAENDRAWINNCVDKIIHSAAILEFYGKDRAGEPWQTNLNGTQNMIALCRELDIRDIHYVSTAYVAGTQENLVLEDTLDVGQSFRNDYEESKFLAETCVRDIDFADHVTVYRPAVIAGDSRTGYTNTYHGIYLYLRLMAMMIPSLPKNEEGRHQTPIRLRMTGDERRNIVPVDWVSAVMVRLFETEEARGGTYTMAPDHPITSGEVVGYCGEYFQSTGALFCGDADLDEVAPVPEREANEDQWQFDRICRENMGTYAPYERSDNLFDMTNLKRFAGDIVCPVVDKTIMYRYIDFGNEDRWGKRPLPRLRNSHWAQDVLAGAVAGSHPESLSSPAQIVGIDVFGFGGYQGTLALGDNRLVAVQQGLPRKGVPVLRVSMDTLLAATENPEQHFTEIAEAWEFHAGTAVQLTEKLLNALGTQRQVTTA